MAGLVNHHPNQTAKINKTDVIAWSQSLIPNILMIGHVSHPRGWLLKVENYQYKPISATEQENPAVIPTDYSKANRELITSQYNY